MAKWCNACGGKMVDDACSNSMCKRYRQAPDADPDDGFVKVPRRIHLIAKYQRWMMVSMVALFPGNAVALWSFYVPEPYKYLLLVAAILFVLFSVWTVYWFALSIYEDVLAAFLFAMTMFIPVVPGLIWLILNAAATFEMRSHQVPVGFFGADLRRIKS